MSSSVLTDYLELQRIPFPASASAPLVTMMNTTSISPSVTYSTAGSASGSGPGPSGGPSSSSAAGMPGAVPDRAAMHRLIMNYLLTEGFKEAAEKFQEEANIPVPTDMGQGLEDRIHVRHAIQQGHIAEAIAMVQDLQPELFDDDKYLLFHLQQQQMIELIRENRIDDALKFASEKLAERGEENRAVLAELERTMALLAFEDPTKSPFGDLLLMSHRQKVASELNAALLRGQHAECVQPKLAGVLNLQLWCQNELEKKGIPFPRVLPVSLGKESKKTK